MKLNDWPSTNKTRRLSTVDLLPDALRAQLVDARLSGSHSVPAMVAWLHNDEQIHTDADVKARCEAVTVSALSSWFLNRNMRQGDGRGDT